ncbi:hypothetical protein F183_A03400 [Bryobacterales bacterium F-183]|nr:hypothetical protein F183_A03400 [Bryobacterales bacterium F-183]
MIVGRPAVVLFTFSVLASAQDFRTTAYPVLEKAGCPKCHFADGVASATRLQFPEQANPAKLEAFGRSLVELVDRANPANSLLLRKPTGLVAHAGGVKIKPGSTDEAALLAWAVKLSKFSDEQVREAANFRKQEAAGVGYDKAQTFLRRLTHHEYNNIVRDLLGDTSQPANQFPPEDFVNGFKTQYQGQTISPLLMEAYSQAAEKIARNAMRRGTLKAAPGFVSTFGLRAFRRPLRADEKQRYDVLYTKGGPQLVAEAMLQSPSFLFRLEDTADAALKPYAAASRLSFTLWGSMPDDDLLAAAAKGLPDVERQAKRLLDNERAKENLDEFTAQWLRFDRILGTAKDRRRYPKFNREAAVAMTEEARRFIRDLVWNDRNFMELFTDPHGYVSADLAAIYEVPAPAREYDRVPFDPKSERGGLLGQALFLASTAKPDDTSPTARGLFVREQLLCQHVPPPPPGVDTNLPELSEARPLTNKERLNVHLSSPSCASCHTLIDPIGLTFEKFDAIGGRREVAKILFPSKDEDKKPKIVELPLDTTGYVAGLSPTPFTSPKVLGEVLAKSEACQECMVKQMYRFVVGRMETPADRPVIRKLTDKFRQSQFRFRELLLALAVERASLR